MCPPELGHDVLLICFSTGFYHDPNGGWYYSSKDGVYYKFEDGNYVPLEFNAVVLIFWGQCLGTLCPYIGFLICDGL